MSYITVLTKRMQLDFIIFNYIFPQINIAYFTGIFGYYFGCYQLIQIQNEI